MLKKYCLFLFILNHFIINSGENTRFLFENISIEKGLSSRSVYCISKDEAGFMWFGTDDGLNRYDGYNFKSFKHNQNDSLSISNSRINCLCVSTKHKIWIGTDKGLNIYNPINETFTLVKPTNDINNELNNSRIRAIYEDTQQNLWIGTQNGLFRYNKYRNEIYLFPFGNLQKNAVFNIIRCIYQDSNGLLWIGTFDGVFSLDPISRKYRHFVLRNKTSNKIANNLILSIIKDNLNEDYLWVGTESGLCKLNKKTGEFESFTAEDNKSGLSNSTIKFISEFQTDEILLGTDEGLNIFNVKTKKAISFFHNNYNNLSLTDNVVSTIFKDSVGIIWLGTNNGISKINTKRKQFNINNIQISSREIIINSITNDNDGNTWVGTFDGIIKTNQSLDQTKKYLFDSKLKINKVCKKLYKDKYGIIWAGTQNGLLYWDKKNDKFVKIVIKENPLLLKYISNITEDQYGNIWTNVNNGLCQIIPKRTENGIKGFTYFVAKINNKIRNNRNNEIDFLKIDKNKQIWFGIASEGLCKYRIDSKVFTRYAFDSKEPKGFSNIKSLFVDKKNTIYVITDRGLYQYNALTNNFRELNIDKTHRLSLQNGVADNNNNLWLTTFLSIIQYNIVTGKTISYDFTQELKKKGFISNSIYKNEQGIIFLGSYDSFVSFSPDKITTDSHISPLHITSFQVFDSEINWEKLSQSEIGSRKEEVVELTHNQNSFKVHFSLLDFYSPINNKYSYKLEGTDEKWMNTSGIQNYASYSNLTPGDYVFKIKAANPDGFWNANITELHIHINPPWWKSWWAYMLYSIVFIILLFYIVRILMSRLKLSNELKQEKIEREKIEEINLIKLRFFTNISHEFRTPLTLILGPLETLMDEIQESKFREQFQIMKTNAERLLRLINQIMDFRKIENKKMELHLTSGEIVSFVKSIYSMFKDHALKRNIEYFFETACSDFIMSYDSDKIEKLIYNLLSNAFKFTPDNGCISIVLDRKTKKEKEYIEILISDTGEGVSSDEQNLIFERFFQSKTKSIELTEGTGIGLNLCKEFVELHSGEISIQSKTGSGSTFIVLLPIVEFKNLTFESPKFEEETENGSTYEKARILIVEDNMEMRNYLRKNLEDSYDIIEAANGKEGLESVQKTIPDIIISDLMMPVMDGLEMCNKVKTNMASSHIPFIILTAKINEESAYEGYSYGADDYITKPFSLKLLRVRIAKLIEKQQKLQQHFKLSILTEPQNVVSESSDDKFIRLIVKTIDENMENFDLNIELLCKALNITHQQVYRKIKALTGQTVSEFIRTVRMKKASQLLCNSDLNISEIMYSVGFSNRSYFSKCFSEQYNLSPKEYKEKELNKNQE